MQPVNSWVGAATEWRSAAQSRDRPLVANDEHKADLVR